MLCQTVEEELKPVASSSKEPNESVVTLPTNPKKRKIAIVQPIGYDVGPEVKLDLKNFEIKKYTAKVYTYILGRTVVSPVGGGAPICERLNSHNCLFASFKRNLLRNS